MDSSSRTRFQDLVVKGDPATDEDVGSGTEGSSDSGAGESEIESMTGKGIKRLCLELLELKKVSDEDFQSNVYSNYSTFVRIFDEVGSMERELMELKQHVSTQRKLIRDLMNYQYLEIVSEDSLDFKFEETKDLGLCSPGGLGAYTDDIVENLDVLLSEHRVEEALILLEIEKRTLRNMQVEEEHLYTSAISERRNRLAEQFAFVAEHPRVTAIELLKALSGLCKLGENYRANTLLLKFYRSRLANFINDLCCSKSFLHWTYIRELAKIVFSVISQAAKSFVILYGENSPYTSELIQWSREETEMFTHYFDKHVKSISDMSGGLSLAVEAVNSAISFCSLLKSQRIVLQPYLTKLIRPCMEEVLQMHVDHFKKVIGILTATDTWVLGKFLPSRILRDESSVTSVDGKLEYFLLTSSGRKFVTLTQAIVDDISPLVVLQMDNSILKGLGDLFNEYMRILERAIPNIETSLENDSPRISSAQSLSQQLSLLVNSSTLVHFFSSIAGRIFKGIKASNNELLPDHSELSLQKELDCWMLLIQEAAERLRGCFCQQFVYDIMSPGDCRPGVRLEVYVDGQNILNSSEVPMPSSAFQALFVRLRQLEELAKSIFVNEDGMVKKLFMELMRTVIVWLSNNQEFWKNTDDSSLVQQHSCFEQFYIDMHFLVETARQGGFFSDNLMDASLDLIAQMELTFTATESDSESAVPDDGWALNAAKVAIEKLLEIELAESHPKQEPVATLGEDLCTHKWEATSLFDEEGAIGTSEDSIGLIDGGSASSVEADITELHEIRNTESTSLEGPMDDLRVVDYDSEGSRSPTTHYTQMEHGQGATEADTVGKLEEETDEDSRSPTTRYFEMEDEEEETGADTGTEQDVEGPAIIAEEESIGEVDECVPNAAQLVTQSPGHLAMEETKLEVTEMLDKLNLDAAIDLLDNSEAAVIALEEDSSKLPSTDTNITDQVGRSVSNNQVEETAPITIEQDSSILQRVNMHDSTDKDCYSSFTISEEPVQRDWPRVADEAAPSNLQSSENGERIADEDTELVIVNIVKNSDEQQGGDGVNSAGDSRDTSDDSERVKHEQRERPRYVAESLRRNRKGLRTSQPHWLDDEAAPSDLQGFEKGGRLAEEDTELVLVKNSDKQQGGDGVNSAWDTRDTSDDSERVKLRRERPRYVAQSLRRNRKGLRISRPRWQ